jgi:peptide/nickel transport system substrate-binding protein
VAPSAAAAAQYALFPEEGMPQYGGQHRTSLAGHSDTLNYVDAGPFQKTSQAAQVLSTLVQYDWETNKDELRPDLAESWESSTDGLVYTFKIRQGVKFHDGTGLSAFDVERFFNHCIDPGTAKPPCAIFTQPYIESVAAPDATTFVINLKAPTPILLQLMAAPGAMGIAPKAILDRPDAMDYMKNKLIGSGAYYWDDDEWQRGISYVYANFADYWDAGLPYVDSIKTFIIRDTATRVAAFEVKKLDVLGRSPSQNQVQQMKSRYGDQVRVVDTPGPCNAYVSFNTEHKPFDNARVRQALYLWWDREEIAQKALPGQYTLGGAVDSGGSLATKDYGSTIEWLEENNLAWHPDKTAARAKALEILKAEGVTPSDFTLDILPIGNEDRVVRATQVIASQLREMGFKTDLRILDFGASYYGHILGDFDVGQFGGCHQMNQPDIWLARTLQDGGPESWTRLVEPNYERIVAEIAKTIDPQKRSSLFAELDTHIQTGVMAQHVIYWRHSVVVEWNWLHHAPNGIPPQMHSHVWLGDGAPK